MAERYYGIDKGEEGAVNVTEGSASTATLDVEVRIDLAAGMTQQEVLLALKTIENFILEDSWPPA